MSIDANNSVYRQFHFGGDRQIVYVGPVPITYQILSTTQPTGLWALVDKAAAQPIPTNNVIEVAGRTIIIEYRTTGTKPVDAYWNTVPSKDVVGPRGAGNFNTITEAAMNQEVLSGATNRIFRFTCGDIGVPSGLWVRSPGSPDQPIPTIKTYIDVGGSNLTIVAQGCRYPQSLGLLERHHLDWTGISGTDGTFSITSLNRTPKRTAEQHTLHSSARHSAGLRVFLIAVETP